MSADFTAGNQTRVMVSPTGGIVLVMVPVADDKVAELAGEARQVAASLLKLADDFEAVSA
ncbi:hypothetical protein WKY82_10370 [Gordonia malaquae]|uniref:hypothetical protein n=1 Tax=Gordonia malaquae TaxID=410332 RepID=UPI0030C78798